MFHSIKIGTNVNQIQQWTDTWKNLGLIPAAPPVVSIPAARTNWVEIPGRTGSLDLTETVTGRVQYGMRSGSWTFVMVHSGMTVIAGNTSEQIADIKTILSRDVNVRYREIVSLLHGKYFKVVLEDEPDYYYEGRLQVGNLQRGQSNSSITISYEFLPYKTKTPTASSSLAEKVL